MESPSPQEENIIKDVRNFFRLAKLKKTKQLIPQLKASHWVNICPWNIWGTFQWDIPSMLGKYSQWNSGEYSKIVFQEYWI